ncbi:hypothetical protein N7530_008740 [Penicillium desertorum]|uniref:Integral membrane bound transporter domain-containing protein n=1 Tax=Penicillium desertorum TaxID=1303715 RepID=A0A9X0BLG7_9EURO|nr:hypothetical protein N7530_008740 [Penicillium desertorum]
MSIADQPQEDVSSRSGVDHVEEREAFISGREVFDREPLTTCIIRKFLEAWHDTRDFIGSEQGVGIFKCGLAYLIASLGVFTPIGKILGHQNGKHLVATITVYFHPARSQGSMYKALICALLAFIFAAVLSLSSMWITILFHEKYDMIELGHAVVLVVFVAGGFGCIGWFKQKMDDPLVNVACSLASLASVIVITKEGAVQRGDLSFEKISQVLSMVLLGVGIAAAVSLSILPVSAQKKYRGNLSTLTKTTMLMLINITQEFLCGSAYELEQVSFTDLSARHDKAYGEMKKQLEDAQLEHYVAGTDHELNLAKSLSYLMQDITRRLSALHSTVALESEFLASSRHSNPTHSPSLNQPETNIEEYIEGRLLSSTRVEEDGLLNYSEAQVIKIFKSQLEESLNLLVSALRTTFGDVAFGPAPDYKISIYGEADSHIDEAIKVYREARTSALRSFSHREANRTLNQESNAKLEEIFASCNYYSVTLLELAEQLQRFLSVLREMQAEIDERPAKRSWVEMWDSWWRAGWRSERRQFNASEFSLSLTGGMLLIGFLAASSVNYSPIEERATTLTDMSIHPIRLESRNPGEPFNRSYDHHGRRFFAFLRTDEVKFALKVGTGAGIYTMPAFISFTRPLYLFWRGEWGLLSYMLVCSMTIGTSNTTGFARIIGTCIGAICSIAAWYVVGANAPGLAFLGFVMALVTFYMIIVKRQGPMGRFILLTYNLSVLYAFSYSQVDNNEQDKSREHLNITQIVIHRVISVTSGCIWGVIITRGIWPIRAWTKLNNTLHLLWLRLLFVWESDPLSAIAMPEENTPACFVNAQAKSEIEGLLSQLEHLRTSARSEFELKKPFPDGAYNIIIRRTRSIVDNFYSLDLILLNAPRPSEGQTSLFRHTAAVRKRLSNSICRLLAVVASSAKQERTCSGALTNIETIRDELLSQIYDFRRQKISSHSTDNVDYVLIHSFGKVSRGETLH